MNENEQPLKDILPYESAGPEPRVLVEDVQRVLFRVTKPDEDEEGASVALIAEKAQTSTRTVYRILSRDLDDPDDPDPSISLDLADRLTIAAGGFLIECRIKWPDDTIEPYAAAFQVKIE